MATYGFTEPMERYFLLHGIDSGAQEWRDFRVHNGHVYKDGRVVVPEGQRRTDTIQQYYINPRTHGGRDKLFNYIKADKAGISRAAIAHYLVRNEVHNTSQPLRKKVTVRPFVISGPNKHVQIDLFPMLKWGHHNNGYQYCLTYIDLFSKYVQLRPIKRKRAEDVRDALQDILTLVPRPSVIGSDNGGEFKNAIVTDYLKSIGIKQIFSLSHTPESQAQVERQNRTTKAALYKLMRINDTRRWIDMLPAIEQNHNSSVQSTTKMRPIDIFNRQLSEAEIKTISDRMLKRVKVSKVPTFSVGDYVRISALTAASERKKAKFRKSATNQNYSTTIFQVYSVSKPDHQGQQPQYLLRSTETNRKWSKRFYGYQLLKTVAPEQVIRTAEVKEQEEMHEQPHDAHEQEPMQIDYEHKYDEPEQLSEPRSRARARRKSHGDDAVQVKRSRRGWQPSAQSLINIASQPSARKQSRRRIAAPPRVQQPPAEPPPEQRRYPSRIRVPSAGFLRQFQR